MTPNGGLVEEIKVALATYGDELAELVEIAELRYRRDIFPTTGQYDWFSAQVLYALIRHRKPDQIIEVSMSSGYSTIISAMALKKNGYGTIDTFELNANLERPVRRLFNNFGVNDLVAIHIGDAQQVAQKVPQKNNVLLFLDSLHSEQFCRWFIEHFVLRATADSLFHVHDVMPTYARVRKAGGPPRTKEGIYIRFKRAVRLALKGFRQSDDGRIPPTIRYEGGWWTYDGNEYSEARFINYLIDKMESGSYAYLHHLVDKIPAFQPHRYDPLAISRQDSMGKPCEWNETVWMYCGAVKKFYKKNETDS